MSLLEILSKEAKEGKSESTIPRPQSAVNSGSSLVPRALLNKSKPKTTAPKFAKPPTNAHTIPATTTSKCPVESKTLQSDLVAPQVTSEPTDLLNLHSFSDVFDPLEPNDFYEQVHKPLEAERLAKMAKMAEIDAQSTNSCSTTPSANAPMLKAEQMMYKQGWKGTGYGLGKDNQGMATPLVGVITSTALADTSGRSTGLISNAPLIIEPSRVILLRNLVHRGKVDPDLAEEICNGCRLYGTVIQCRIEEEKNGEKCSDSEAVRVFVQFESAQAASVARAGLNGRFFDGNPIKATFYPEAAFLGSRYWLAVPVD